MGRFQNILLVILLIILAILSIIAGKFVAEHRSFELRGRTQDISSPTPLSSLKLDFDKSGAINSSDCQIFLEKFKNGDIEADLDESGEVNSLDWNIALSQCELQ